MDPKITITLEEVNSPKVEAKLKERELVTRTQEHYEQTQLPTATARPSRLSFLYNSVVYLGLFGLLGGVLGWTFGHVMHFRASPRDEARELIDARRQLEIAVAQEQLEQREAELAAREIDRTGRDNPYYAIHIDPRLSDEQKQQKWSALSARDDWQLFLANALFYCVCGVTIAVCLAIADSLVERNWQAAATNAAVGAIVGLVGGMIVSLLVDQLYAAILNGPDTDAALPRRIAARAASWGLLGLFLAAAPGIVLRHVKKVWIGAAGGLIGGVIGGVLFEPLARATGEYHTSRLIAVAVIGAVAGIATGLIEQAAKTGWLKVVAGVIAGKQFVLYRNPTYIGSSPHCHIYLFRDAKVGRRHAAIHVLPGGYEIEDLPLGSRTMVNGRPVLRTRLRNGDHVQIGSTSFHFQEKSRS